MKELKPCPFCGSNSVTVQFVSPPYFLEKFRGRYIAAGCNDCGAATRLFCGNFRTGSKIPNERDERTAKENAIEAWNRRANND